jgi:hypothetical protein
MTTINMENTDNFDILIINPNKINDISWLDIDYSKKLMNLDIFEIYNTNKDDFINTLSSKLNISSFDIPNITVKNEIIGEEPYYVYELLYIDTKNTKYENDSDINELASLLNINEDNDKVYHNAVILKSYLPSLTDSMIISSITKKDIELLLYHRVYTKVVIWDWDKGWKEEIVSGDLLSYVNVLFEGNDYKKINLDFLMHDINIWYVEDKYGDKVCGNLIDKPLEKCIWFSMKSEELRGNLTLNEVNKIINLSLKLTSYKVPVEFTIEKKDKYDRKIIYNKYKVLDSIYNNIS